MKHEKIATFLRSHFSTLLVGLVFSLGCECCCDCKDKGVGALTIDITFLPIYTSRTCPIPVPAGALSGIGGKKIPTITGEPFHTGTSYYLWVEFESCCEDFAYSTEFRALVDAGTAWHTISGNKRALYTIALNATAGSSSPTFPIPTSSSDGNGIEGGSVMVHYWEPCMTGCESPLPACGTFSFRPTYTGTASTTRANVSTPVILMWSETKCETNRGFLCAP